MCFSPQADVAGGLLICAIGVDAVRHIGRRREFIALAWIPALLGAHQFIEALVWLWLQGHVPRGIGHVALWAYLLIAFVVLPVFVPLAVIAAEPARRRKQVMAPFALIGAVIAVTLLAAMVRGPVGVKLAPYHLSYGIRLPDGLVIVALYVVAVCGPLLMSGYRNVVLFGVVNLIAVVIIARLTISGFASVWCGWAAVSSAAITLHCRFVRPRPERARSGSDGLMSASRSDATMITGAAAGLALLAAMVAASASCCTAKLPRSARAACCSTSWPSPPGWHAGHRPPAPQDRCPRLPRPGRRTCSPPCLSPRAGLGITELGLIGVLVGGAGHKVGAQVTAAVLIYRAVTYLPSIPLGAFACLTWRYAPAL